MREIQACLPLVALSVLLGSGTVPAAAESGLTPGNVQTVWDRDAEAEDFDRFGKTLGMGDFDGDGLGDPVAAWQATVGAADDAGAIAVLCSDPFRTTDVWHQDSSGIAGVAEEDDSFGLSIAIGDFDGDGYDDLAIGAPYEDLEGTESHTDAGVVHVLYGSSSCLTATGSQLWFQGEDGLVNGPDSDDRFGFALASGDFDGDTYDDLAVGVPGDDVGGGQGASRGMVHMIYGSSGGLTGVGDDIFWQGTDNVEDFSEDGDLFGWVLASGNIDGDAYDDLVVGVPWEDLPDFPNPDPLSNAGAIHVVFGSATGPSAANDVFLSQNSTDVAGDAGAEESFAWSVATGDVNGDGYDEILVGIRDHSTGFFPAVSSAGGVHVFYGSAAGVDLSNDFVFSQNASSDEVAETDDHFGVALATGDFDADGFDDVVVGVPDEDLDGTTTQSGVVHVFYGSDGAFPGRDQTWRQGPGGLFGIAETNDSLGEALAAGEYNGKTGDDLLIGVPGENLSFLDPSVTQGGGVNFLFGDLVFADGFEEGNASAWSSSVP